MPTATQRKLAKTGDHHLTVCLQRSRSFALPKGDHRLFCELSLGHDMTKSHAATVDGVSIRWRDTDNA